MFRAASNEPTIPKLMRVCIYLGRLFFVFYLLFISFFVFEQTPREEDESIRWLSVRIYVQRELNRETRFQRDELINRRSRWEINHGVPPNFCQCLDLVIENFLACTWNRSDSGIYELISIGYKFSPLPCKRVCVFKFSWLYAQLIESHV